MSSPLIVRYNLDPTGISPDNLVVGEEHTLTKRLNRTLTPTYGAYYEDSVILVDMDTNKELIKGVQWYPGELYEVPTAKYGKGIYALIVITDTNVSNNVKVQYQALGGEYCNSVEAISTLINALDLDDRPVYWPNVVARPAEYPPSKHLHDIGDVYGFEYLTHAIDRVRAAIEFGDEISHSRIYLYIDQRLAEFEIRIKKIIQTAIDTGNVDGDVNDLTEDQIYFAKENFTQTTSESVLAYMTQEKTN